MFICFCVVSDIGQGIGWGSIIYLAALAGIDQPLYEAACIDGPAGRWSQMIHITQPGIMPTAVILLISVSDIPTMPFKGGRTGTI